MQSDLSMTNPRAMQQLEDADDCACTENVGMGERMLSIAGGSALLFAGLSRRGLGGWMAMVGGAGLLYRGITGNCQMYQMLGLNTAVEHHDRVGVRAQHGQKVEHTIRVSRKPRELYDYWRSLNNLPRVMEHLESVTPIDARRSKWVAHGPLNQPLEWEAEIINDEPGELIAWRSLPGSQVDTAGSVHFCELPNGEGTDVHVSLKYDPPGGKSVAALADMLGQGLEHQLQNDLETFKQHMEDGSRQSGTERQQQREESVSRARAGQTGSTSPQSSGFSSID